MPRKSAPGIEPYPFVLLGLFVLSFLAVRTWTAKHMVSRGPQLAGELPVATGAGGRAQGRADDLPAVGETGVATSVDPTSVDASLTARVLRSDMELEPIAPEPNPLDLALLDSFSTPRVSARVAPPVSSRIAASVEVPEQQLVPAAPEIPADSLRVASRIRRRGEPPRSTPLWKLPRQEGTLEFAAPIAWPPVPALESLLDELTAPEVAGWADRVRSLLHQLAQTSSLGSRESARILAELRRAVDEAPVIDTRDATAASLELASRVARARHGLDRRVMLWQQVERAIDEEPVWRVSLDRGDLRTALRRADQFLEPVGRAGAWRDYLMLDEARRLVEQDSGDPNERRVLAQTMLERMHSDHLTDAQRRFLEGEPFHGLRDQLRRWAYEPIDYAELLRQIEAIESGETAGHEALANYWRTLRWSPWQQTGELGQVLNTYYRNANIRLAISGEFINRMLPPLQTTEEEVEDQILGTPVAGRSTTITRLFVELIPDRMRWRLGLVARGHIDSQTRADKGAVTLFTNGATRYRARKLLTIDRAGIWFNRTETEAQNSTELAEVTSNLDGVPLLGSLVRSLARRGHAERADEANAEVEYKVGNRVAQRLDDEVMARIQEAEAQYTSKLLNPLRRLQLNPTAIDMQTTDQRLIVRYRVAADDQLAAYTPRPLAPGDSLLSCQIHESAINNIIGRLHLAGREATLADLYCELGSALGKPVDRPEDLPDDISIRFADIDPVVVRFVDQRAELTINVAEMRSGRNVWNDFQVHTKFSPEVAEACVRLVRNDVIEVRGNFGFRERLPLRAMFNAILARERPIPVLDPRITQSPKIGPVDVSQFVLIDGWLGVALSPRPRTARAIGPIHVSLSDSPDETVAR